MKQVDKPKKPGAPVINGKETHDGIPQLRNKAESNSNLQFKSTSTSNLHYLKDEVTHKQSTSIVGRINRYRSTSSINEAHKYNKRLPLPSTKFYSTSGGISSVDTVSTSNSTTSKIGKSLNSRTKIIPPIPGGTLKTKQKSYHDSLKNISHIGSTSRKAQPLKVNPTENVSRRERKQTYTVEKNNLRPKLRKNEEEEEEIDDDDDDTLEQSEDDAKSNMTYRVR